MLTAPQEAAPHAQRTYPARKSMAMPSVIHAPAIVAHDAHTIDAAQPPVRGAHSGFWHTVLQYVTRHRVSTPHGTSSSAHGPLHGFETPADLLAREYPSLYIRAYAGV